MMTKKLPQQHTENQRRQQKTLSKNKKYRKSTAADDFSKEKGQGSGAEIQEFMKKKRL